MTAQRRVTINGGVSMPFGSKRAPYLPSRIPFRSEPPSAGHTFAIDAAARSRRLRHAWWLSPGARGMDRPWASTRVWSSSGPCASSRAVGARAVAGVEQIAAVCAPQEQQGHPSEGTWGRGTPGGLAKRRVLVGEEAQERFVHVLWLLRHPPSAKARRGSEVDRSADPPRYPLARLRPHAHTRVLLRKTLTRRRRRPCAKGAEIALPNGRLFLLHEDFHCLGGCPAADHLPKLVEQLLGLACLIAQRESVGQRAQPALGLSGQRTSLQSLPAGPSCDDAGVDRDQTP